MIPSLEEGGRTMLKNDRLGSPRVLDSPPIKRVGGK
jgi:hypothetical protein